MSPRSLFLFAFLLSISLSSSTLARSPNRVFKGKIILSKRPFPFRFKSDKALIRHMKRVNSKSFRYDEEGNINIEFMAFFARPQSGSQFSATSSSRTPRPEATASASCRRLPWVRMAALGGPVVPEV